jgi:hypothetical protein
MSIQEKPGDDVNGIRTIPVPVGQFLESRHDHLGVLPVSETVEWSYFQPGVPRSKSAYTSKCILK